MVLHVGGLTRGWDFPVKCNVVIPIYSLANLLQTDSTCLRIYSTIDIVGFMLEFSQTWIILLCTLAQKLTLQHFPVIVFKVTLIVRP